MPENILILADWKLATIVEDAMPPRDPTTMMTRKRKKRRRTRRGTIGRQLSGNPNPTSSAHPLSRKAIPSAPIATGRRLFRVESGSRGKATDRAARENVSGSRSRARHEGKAEQRP